MPADPVIPRQQEITQTTQGGRAVSAPLQGTESAKDAIGRVKYSHDAMIDVMIANPGITQNELAKHFGFTPPWVSRVVNSDAFQARLAVRKADIIDPNLIMSVQERLTTLANASLDVLIKKLSEPTVTADMAFRGVEVATKALGYGARPERNQQPVVNNSFVVALPTQIPDQSDWSNKYGGGPEQKTLAQRVEDVQAKEV